MAATTTDQLFPGSDFVPWDTSSAFSLAMAGAQPIEDFDFPPELLLIIKEFVEDWDLRTHVCFYLSSPKVAALYDSGKHPDAFWRLACWNNGLTGGPTDVVDFEDEDEDMRDEAESHFGGPSPWRDVAVDYITRDGFCTHPHCGEALLEYNRKPRSHVAHAAKAHGLTCLLLGQCMREAQEDVQVFKPIHSRSEDDSLSPLIAHQVFEHIEFKQFSDVFRRSRVEDDAHLRAPGDSPRRGTDLSYMHRPDDYPGMYLAEHPLVAGSFATSPPVDSVMLLHLIGRPLPGGIVVQTGPVTVLDIVSAIHEG